MSSIALAKQLQAAQTAKQILRNIVDFAPNIETDHGQRGRVVSASEAMILRQAQDTLSEEGVAFAQTADAKRMRTEFFGEGPRTSAHHDPMAWPSVIEGLTGGALMDASKQADKMIISALADLGSKLQTLSHSHYHWDGHEVHCNPGSEMISPAHARAALVAFEAYEAALGGRETASKIYTQLPRPAPGPITPSPTEPPVIADETNFLGDMNGAFSDNARLEVLGSRMAFSPALHPSHWSAALKTFWGNDKRLDALEKILSGTNAVPTYSEAATILDLFEESGSRTKSASDLLEARAKTAPEGTLPRIEDESRLLSDVGSAWDKNRRLEALELRLAFKPAVHPKDWASVLSKFDADSGRTEALRRLAKASDWTLSYDVQSAVMETFFSPSGSHGDAARAILEKEARDPVG